MDHDTMRKTKYGTKSWKEIKRECDSMTTSREMMSNIVHKLISNGTMDDLVVVVLEEQLANTFEDLEKLHQKKYLEAHHWQDYVDHLKFAHSCIKVLQYFSTDTYTEQQIKANQYSLKLESVF